MDYRAYIDSSVILRKLLREKGAIADLTQWQLFSSQLLDVEVRRTLQRYHFEGALAPFPTLIKTLDAIHLATALAWTRQTEEPIVVLTHDRQFGIAASACGYPVVP
jgi:hypothetical protein